ncbi:uncharacterized protein C8R40DRAFT_1134836 [Lentinula edodes]|uniref:uncharacterized protein n=1 Tax=Lentinula edodes TaxID=5353 RepID=UPI001E8D2858|nr:uncharacterized protein C8R40DRAFT_1134836 [Lentinula edodes]KAH7868460.1 hypothetical protein C8R40DRAFT_1134836 [Lentinula edodes]
MASSYNNDSLSITPSWPSLYNPRSELFDIQRHNPIQPGGFYLVNSQDVFRFTLYWTLVFYIPVFVLFGLYAFFNLTFPPHTNREIAFGRLHDEEDDAMDDDEEEEDEDEEAYPMSPMSSDPHPPRHRHNPRNGYYATLRSEITTTSTVPTTSPPSVYIQSPTSATAGHPFLSVSHTSPAHFYPPHPSSSSHSPMITKATGNTKTPVLRNFSKSLNKNKVMKANKSKNAARSRITFALLVFFGFLILSLIGAVVSSAIVGYILTGLYKAGKFYMSTWVPFLWAAISVMVGMLNVWPSVINLI